MITLPEGGIFPRMDGWEGGSDHAMVKGDACRGERRQRGDQSGRERARVAGVTAWLAPGWPAIHGGERGCHPGSTGTTGGPAARSGSGVA